MSDEGHSKSVSRRKRTDDADERLLRIWAAKRNGDAQYLIGALRDPDYRATAAKFVGELEVVEAIDPLFPLLEAADPHARAAAATALAQLGARQALPRLREMAAHDEESFVRSWVVAALGEIGDPSDVDLILPFLSDPSARVRGAAALALGQLGDVRALEPLWAARKKLRRSPVEWHMHRRVYKQSLDALERQRLGQ
jgi:HEAT repeat protein